MPRLYSFALARQFLVIGILSCAAASAAPPASQALRIPHEKFVLDNGLTVLVHSDAAVPLVGVNLWYHVGSRDERRGRTGFAHLFEHFFFNGSEHYPHGFREAMDDLGANNRNGTTSNDRTNFFEDVPVSALERTLYLEADRMGWLAGNLSEEMLERERGVVKNEKRQRENQPYGRVYSRIVEMIYPYSHPYSWSPIGSMEDLDAADLDDIKDWYAAYYGPGNAVLSLAGDISAEHARELAQKYFGAIPPGPPIARLARWVPTLEADIRDSMQDRVPQQRIYRVWHAPAYGERATHELELFAGVLAGSESSALDRRLVFDTQLATDVGAFVWANEIASTFIVQMSVKPGADAAAAERELDAAIASVLDAGPGVEELARARTREVADFTRGIERLGGFGGRSDVLAESQTFLGDASAYLRRFDDFSAATPRSVGEHAREWLGRHHYTLVVEPLPERVAIPDTLDRSRLPDLAAPPEVGFPRLQRTVLPNGLKLVLIERHSAPLVDAALIVDAGYSADGAETAGIANLAQQLLLKGTTTRDAFRIADERDALGLTLGAGSTLDQSLVRMSALSASLDGAFALFADVARNPAFPSDMVEIQRKQQLAAISQQKANPTGAALRALPALLYGAGHPYAISSGGLGDERSIAAISREALMQWHAHWFRPNNATLVVAGDVTLAQLTPLVERSFGDWVRAEVPEKRIVMPTSSGARGRIHVIDRPGASQSVIVAVHLVPPAGRDDDLALETSMRNFGGMATSRLNRNLRLDKHWSYGASGYVTGARGSRQFTVLAPVQTDKTREAVAEIRKEIRGLAGERPLAGDELDSILRSQVARLPGRFETLDALVGAAIDVVNVDRDPAYYYDYASHMRALEGDDLNASTATLVKPDELTWLVIGDLARIRSGLVELGYGEIVELESDARP